MQEVQERQQQEQFEQGGRIDRTMLWCPPYDGLKFWVRLWYDGQVSLQRLNRFLKDVSDNGGPSSRTMQLIKRLFAQDIFNEVEAAKNRLGKAEAHIVEIVRELPEWNEWGKHVPGLGEKSLGKLLGLIGNPAAREYPSSLFRHCGLGVANGKLEKAQKGQRRPYNTKAKAQLWLIANSCVKAYARTPNLYGELYYTYKERFATKHPDWTKMHCHLAALLKVGKFFLSHLWTVCRQTQGLPVRLPYPVEHLGHKVIITPEMALHPVKRREEVARAIESVRHLLESEEDQDVITTTEKLLAAFEVVLRKVN